MNLHLDDTKIIERGEIVVVVNQYKSKKKEIERYQSPFIITEIYVDIFE